MPFSVASLIIVRGKQFPGGRLHERCVALVVHPPLHMRTAVQLPVFRHVVHERTSLIRSDLIVWSCRTFTVHTLVPYHLHGPWDHLRFDDRNSSVSMRRAYPFQQPLARPVRKHVLNGWNAL